VISWVLLSLIDTRRRQEGATELAATHLGPPLRRRRGAVPRSQEGTGHDAGRCPPSTTSTAAGHAAAPPGPVRVRSPNPPSAAPRPGEGQTPAGRRQPRPGAVNISFAPPLRSFASVRHPTPSRPWSSASARPAADRPHPKPSLPRSNRRRDGPRHRTPFGQCQAHLLCRPGVGPGSAQPTQDQSHRRHDRN
jgi:hypothetical protein